MIKKFCYTNKFPKTLVTLQSENKSIAKDAYKQKRIAAIQDH